MAELEPIYAPDYRRPPGRRKIVQVRNIPQSIAEVAAGIADSQGSTPDDVIARAILHFSFFTSQEMNGNKILLRTAENESRELDFGITEPGDSAISRSYTIRRMN